MSDLGAQEDRSSEANYGVDKLNEDDVLAFLSEMGEPVSTQDVAEGCQVIIGTGEPQVSYLLGLLHSQGLIRSATVDKYEKAFGIKIDPARFLRSQKYWATVENALAWGGESDLTQYSCEPGACFHHQDHPTLNNVLWELADGEGPLSTAQVAEAILRRKNCRNAAAPNPSFHARIRKILEDGAALGNVLKARMETYEATFGLPPTTEARSGRKGAFWSLSALARDYKERCAEAEEE